MKTDTDHDARPAPAAVGRTAGESGPAATVAPPDASGPGPAPRDPGGARVEGLLLRPLWGLATPSFGRVWEALWERMERDWRGGSRWRRRLPDRRLLATAADLKEAAILGLRALRFVARSLDRDGAFTLLPVQAVVVSVTDAEDGPVEVEADWAALPPGRLCVQRALIKPGGPLAQSGETAGDPRFVTVGPTVGSADLVPPLFLYQGVLAAGERSPCFYCGDRRHASADCPSKQAPDRPQALEALGRLDPSVLNRRFYEALEKRREGRGASSAAEPSTPYAGFLDLKYVCQLRMLKRLWSSEAADWDTLFDRSPPPPQGGPIWLAYDCLRTGNRNQAVKLLERSSADHGGDYRAHCLRGLADVERGAPARARVAFQEALACARRVPEKIFVLFLLLRIHRLAGDPIRAERTLRRIRIQDRNCLQADYEGVKLQLEDGQTGRASEGLKRLVEQDRSYFVAALIDPELAPHAPRIQNLLIEWHAEARKRAVELKVEAEAEVARVEAQLGQDTLAALRPAERLAEIDTRLADGSYFGCRDAVDGALRLAAEARRALQIHQRSVIESLHALALSLRQQMAMAEGFPEPWRMAGVRRQLVDIYGGIESLRRALDRNEPGTLLGAPAKTEEWARQLERTERQIQRICQTYALWRFAVALMRNGLVLAAIHALAVVFLLPMAVHYLVLFLPAGSLSSYDLWHWQKTLLALGGPAALLFALAHTLRHHSPVWSWSPRSGPAPATLR